jgi:hypothetical protein
VVDVFPLGDGNGVRDHLFLRPAIGVGEKKPIARSGGRAEVAGMALAQPARGKGINAWMYPGILEGQPLQDTSRAVLCAIADREHFLIDVFLRQNMAERLLNPSLLVPSRQHHADSGLMLWTILKRWQSMRPSQARPCPERGEREGQRAGDEKKVQHSAWQLT